MVSRFFNATFSVYNGLKDKTVELSVGSDQGSKSVRFPLPALCALIVASLKQGCKIHW